jgi:hypothetical protein
MISLRGTISGLRALPSVRLGQCERCTRAALVAAVSAWILTLTATLAFRRLDVAMAIGVPAAALTALWIAHVVSRSSRGTVASMLRAFGATASEAKAIVDAFAQPAGRAWRLREGQALRVQLAPRPNGRGMQLSRVAIADDRGVATAVALASNGTYAALDRSAVEAAEHVAAQGEAT